MHIDPIDPVLHMRSHPELYLGVTGLSLADLACRLVGDALVLGCSEVLCKHIEPWWFVHASDDWLEKKIARTGVLDSFRRPIPLPELFPNAIMSHTLVAAYCGGVGTISSDKVVSVINGDLPDYVLGHALVQEKQGRTVMFRR